LHIPDAGLVDEQQKVRTITALAIAALAEAATPYGIESFDSVLKPLWKGIRTHRGKVRPLKSEKNWCSNVGYSVLFYYCPQHCSCLGMSWQIQTFGALELLCLLH
jgi:hypothetical protein